MAQQANAECMFEERRAQLLNNIATRLARVLAPLAGPGAENAFDGAVSAESTAESGSAEDAFGANGVLAQTTRLLLRSMHVFLRYSDRERLCVSKHIRALWALAAADNEYYPLYCVLAARQVTAPGHPRLQDPRLFHLDLVKTAQDLPAGPTRAEAIACFHARYEQLFGVPPVRGSELPARGGNATAGAFSIFDLPADAPADSATTHNTKGD